VVLSHAGLKIVVPSTPHDARALMAAAVADPDPVLYYEHIALYRDPRIKQTLAPSRPRRCRSAGARCGAPATTSRSFLRRVRATSRCASPERSRRRHSGQRARLRTLVPLDKASSSRSRALQPRC
jgi:pyruvate/2-oxoglutarate/acetoin dehydrogenase E1 component